MSPDARFQTFPNTVTKYVPASVIVIGFGIDFGTNPAFRVDSEKSADTPESPPPSGEREKDVMELAMALRRSWRGEEGRVKSRTPSSCETMELEPVSDSTAPMREES